MQAVAAIARVDEPGNEGYESNERQREDRSMEKVIEFVPDLIGLSYEKLEIEPIPLGEETRIEVQLAEVDIKDLRLDQRNPRIQFKIQSRGVYNPTKEELADILFEDDDVVALQRSIRFTGGIIEPIIVQGSDGTVLEGNSRTACYWRLAKDNPDDPRWRRIKARIVPAGVSREQINVLLGELHIAGKNKWSAFEQAAHLYEMNKKQSFSINYLADAYRQSKTSISNKLRAYELMVDKYLPRTHGETSPLDKWSYFEEFFKVCRPGNNEEGIALQERFVEWMVAGKFKKGEEVRWLKEILQDPEAVEALETKDVRAAADVVREDSPELESKLFKAVVKATEELSVASMLEVAAIQREDGARVAKLRQLDKALKALAEQAGIEL